MKQKFVEILFYANPGIFNPHCILLVLTADIILHFARNFKMLSISGRQKHVDKAIHAYINAEVYSHLKCDVARHEVAAANAHRSTIQCGVERHERRVIPIDHGLPISL